MSANDLWLFFENRKALLPRDRSLVIGRDRSCDVILSDRRVSRKHALLENRDGAVVLVDLGSANGSWYEGKRVERATIRANTGFRLADCNLSLRLGAGSAPDEELAPGETMIFEARVQDVLSRLEDEGAREDVAALRHLYNRRKEALEELAFCDALTGIFNRRHFDRCFAEECARSRRYSRPLSLIMVDIDHFKRVNDEYGHQKGDQILHLVGQTLRALVRQTDMVFRYGGEELVILLPETHGADAATVAEHCRTRIAAASTALLPAGISVSLGIAELGSDEADSALLGRADTALYEAKRTGRNRSIMAK